MARQLIICCDGTSNNLTGRRNDTNVAQLCELLAPDSNQQLLYYDPGVGNAGLLPEATTFDEIKQQVQRVSSLAFGSGIYENIAEAYRFVMRHWQSGDQLFLYGFSRGAFTARSLGGLITQFGILRPEMEVMVPTLLHVYFLDRDRYQSSYDHIKAQINQLFTSGDARKPSVWFVGVWDTVESVGAPMLRRRITATPTIVGKRFHHVRHALALDEFRHKFKPRQYFIEEGYDYAAHQQSIAQQWFSGCHSDVGGSYENHEAGLSQQALLWMVQESVGCGLRLDSALLSPATGQADPDQIIARLAQRMQPPLASAPRKIIHSALYSTPWWALAGMTVREMPRPPHMPQQPHVVSQRPVESPTVASNALRFPQDSEWAQRRSLGALLLAALLCVVLWAVAGGLLVPAEQLQGPHWWSTLLALPQVQQANNQFALWQLAWLVNLQPPSSGLAAFAHPARAVLVDFGLIVAYSYLLSRAISWAFATLAGARRAGSAPPRWLNRLGMAGACMLAGDVLENLLTLGLIAIGPTPYVPSLEWIIGLLMSAASGVKWLGLAGCVALTVWACVARFARPSR